MMNLLNLPEEIIIVILRQLDTKSVFSLYNTCSHLRNIICMRNVIKECHLSLNTLATVRSLKSNFFKSISGHLQELDMSGIDDMCKTSLLPVLKSLKCLLTLNVAYTKITLTDLLELYDQCPTIKNICIDFRFSKRPTSILHHYDLKQYQNLFSNFENVNFIGTVLNLFHMGQSVLCNAKLKHLKFTVSEARKSLSYDSDHVDHGLLDFNQFTAYFLNWKQRMPLERSFFSELYCHSILMPYNRIVIYTCNENYKVTASPLFQKFFGDNFGINIDIDLFNGFGETSITSQYIVMAWSNNTKFDSLFFNKLYFRIKKIFPCNFMKSVDILDNNWFFVKETQFDDVAVGNVKNNGTSFKRSRVVPSNIPLNYDSRLKEKETMELSIVFDYVTIPITLPLQCNYLKKLTYLSLTGNVRYSMDFFNILFRSCNKLVTLNVEGSPLSPCASPVTRSIPLTHTLKNLRLSDRQIDLETLFSALSQCKSLENIQIHETTTSKPCDVPNPFLVFKNCDNLYYFSVYAFMSETSKTKKIKMFNKAKAVCKKYHLCTDIYNFSVTCGRHVPVDYRFDPYINVFKLYPINSSV